MIGEYIHFKKDNPFSKLYSHGVVFNGAICLYKGAERSHFQMYDRYLESVKIGRILTMAEYESGDYKIKSVYHVTVPLGNLPLNKKRELLESIQNALKDIDGYRFIITGDDVVFTKLN